MSRVTELEKALTTLFRKGTEVGYAETEIDEFLENIDYHALLQAVWNKAETVYAYQKRIWKSWAPWSRWQSQSLRHRSKTLRKTSTYLTSPPTRTLPPTTAST